MLAVVVSTLVINYFFIPPRHLLWIAQPEDVFRLGIFLLVTFVITLLSSNTHNSKHKIEQLSQQLVQESTEPLLMAPSAAQMGMWNWDMVTGKIKWSPEHEQLFGLANGTFDGKRYFG